MFAQPLPLFFMKKRIISFILLIILLLTLSIDAFAAEATTIVFTEQGLQTGSYDKIISASITLGEDEDFSSTYSTIYLVTATNADVKFQNNASRYFDWAEYKFLSADAEDMWTVGTTYSVNDSALNGVSVTKDQLKAAGIPDEAYDTSCSAFYLIGFDGSYVNSGIDFAVLVQVKAESTTIPFTEQGLQTGSYDKIISASVTLGEDEDFASTYSTIYLVTATNADVKFQNNASRYFDWAEYKFLSADAEDMWTVGTTYSVNDSALNGISVTKDQLKAAGIPDEAYDTSCSAFYLIGFDGSYVNSGIDFAVLVQVKGAATSLTDAQKKPLTDLLATVADGNDKYVQSGDRYNGKPADTITSKNGSFWAEFTAVNGPRAKAQKALQDAKTEADITAAVAELQAAISKLIPASQLNATYLYETLQQYNYGEEYLENCTVPSAQGFRAVRSEAQNYFDTLFNSDGSATGVNIAANQKTADDYADALKNYTLVFNDQVDEAKVNLRTIQALAKRYAMTENSGKYTGESWTAFETARKAATDYAAAHSVSEYISDAEVKQYAALTREFLSAAYGLTSASDTVTVTFSYTDDLHLRVPNPNDPYNQMVDPVGNKPQIQTVTLNRGATLADLWTKTGYKPSRSYYGVSEYSVWHTFVNGTMLYGVTPGAKQDLADDSYVLKDGDKIQLTHMDWPSYTFNYIYRAAVDWTSMTNSLAALRFKETGAQNVGAGEEATLTVERTSAHLWTYTGSYNPYEGATIAAYGPQNKDGSYPDTPILSETTSDASGSVSFKLYQEGKYLVTAYDARANDEDSAIFYSGTVAAPYLELTVGDATQPDAVRAELKAALDKVYNAYPKKIFGDDTWAEIEAAYKVAVATLNDSTATTGEAYLAQQAAIRTIQSKQTETIQANKTALETFRTNLNKLPDDVNKITASASVKEAATTLIQCYTSMNSYQRSQLTNSEKAKYDKIKAYMDEKGEKLPEAEKYKLTLNTVVRGGTEEDTEAINAMIANLRNNPAKMDRAEGGKYDRTQAINIVTPYTFGAYDGKTELFSKTFSETDPLIPVRIYTGVDYAAYFQTRNANGTYTTASTRWSISDEDLSIVLTREGTNTTPGVYGTEGHLTVKIGDTEYEVKSITYEGISRSDVISGTQRVYDDSGYKGKSTEVVNVDIPDAYLGFAMPYNDVTVTITWGPVESDSAKLETARKTATNVVKAKYNALVAANEYDAEHRDELDAALATGLTEIKNATSESDVIAARKKAVSAMEKVPTIGSSSESGKVGEHYPYSGSEVVGRVHVIVENTTYLDESLPDSLKKTIVKGYYDLTKDDSMMTVALKALEGAGCTWNRGGYDYGTTYLASVEKDGGTLAEFTGGPNAGWMGTKNDWFVNASFSEFRYQNGGLADGDEIHLMYTTKLGADIGGTWSGTDTSLQSLIVSGAELSPAFSGSTTNYVLTIPDEATGVTVRFTAANKNYQARMYLNSYKDENSRYMSGDMLSVTSGDVIYVGVGERAWGSMNNGGTATKYTIQVVKSGDAKELVEIIDDLPAASRLTLDDARTVRMARSLFDALDPAAQATFKKDHKAQYNKLAACEKVIDDMAAADAVTTAANNLPSKPNLRDKATFYAAKAALDALTADQKQYLTAETISVINQAYEQVLEMDLNHVQWLIDELPDEDKVTLADKKQIDAAKAAYDALPDQTGVDATRLGKAIAALKKLEQGGSGEDTGYSEYLKKALANIKKKVPTPTIGSSSGEWAVLALARGNADVLNSYYDGYYDRVVAYVRDNISSGKLNADKSTDNARIALALTAIGEDPTSVGGHNLLTALDDVTYDLKQGINGPIWALIALDSKNYTSSSRDQLIKAILDGRTNDGGWALDGNATDVDMTAMAIQALAPYYNKSNETVKDAVDTALAWLSTKQSSDGGFSSWGKANAESCAQVIVALSALNIDADTDSRFVKNGHSALENLLTFEQADGSFFHVSDGSDGNNQMTSEQGTYALVAYDRFKTGKNSLYNMTDAVKRADASAQEVIDMINQIGYVDESSYTAIAEARNAYDELSTEDQAKVTNYSTLTAAETSYKAILKQKQTDQYKALKAHYDDLLNDKTKKYGTAAKKKLASILQQAQTDMNSAVSCERVTDIYEKAIADLDAVKPGDIEVTFRLIGALEATQDVDLTTDSYLPEYVTWVPTKTYALQENATVYDLFTEAMSDAGLRYIGAENNYVSTIYAPSCLGGYALSEFTNGKKSGWMYTVNGKHPNQGLKNWTLNDGDVVIWHYVNDYSCEVADWFNDSQYPSLGDGSYYNSWLRARDITPEQYVQQLLAKILTVGKHGTVEPKLTFQHIGKSVTFTFKPDTGYKVKDVKVNGKSVGAVKTYTIDKLTVSTRIEVEFTDESLPFTDVRESDWFYDDVVFAYENGLFSGTSDTTFSPNTSMTRAMLVTVLYRLEGQPAVNGRSGFSDVQYNGYYEDAVTWAADNGIVNGTSTSTFSPNVNVTREQMAAILYRYAQYKKYNTAASSSLNSFSDHTSVSGYAVASLQWSVAEKLVNGSNGKLMPTGNASRAQVAAILHRFAENVAKTTK